MNIRATATSLLLSFSLVISLLPGVANAAGFLRIDGIDGESQDADHDKWIDILSVTESISRDVSDEILSGRARGTVVLDDIVMRKEVDRTSPRLREKLARGEVIPKVEIELTKNNDDGGRATYFKYELTNVIITSVSMSGSALSEQVPTEQLSLNFEEIKWTYFIVDRFGNNDGRVEAQWDKTTGTAQ